MLKIAADYVIKPTFYKKKKQFFNLINYIFKTGKSGFIKNSTRSKARIIFKY